MPQAEKAINMKHDKKISGKNLLEYHVFYKHRNVCSCSNKINGQTARNFQRKLIRATSVNRKMTGETSNTLLIQSYSVSVLYCLFKASQMSVLRAVTDTHFVVLTSKKWQRRIYCDLKTIKKIMSTTAPL